MEYEKPIKGEFTATAYIPITENWEKFLRAFARMGKARITVVSTLRLETDRVGLFQGEFVALQR
ncbi:hypothetical protein GCM10025856_28270 [Methylophaga marina]|nr:hypothetical protein GCM10025856_28270 [Methylophaga marina]